MILVYRLLGDKRKSNKAGNNHSVLLPFYLFSKIYLKMFDLIVESIYIYALKLFLYERK